MNLKDAKDFLIKIQKNKDKKLLNQGYLNEDLISRKNLLDLNIAVGLDVSGSISPATFKQFMLQLDAIKGLSRVKVLEVNTDIVAMYDYYKANMRKVVRLSKGGGTDFTTAFIKFRQLKPDAILFMTDGEVSGHISPPDIPVGWIVTAPQVPPYGFGEVVAVI